MNKKKLRHSFEFVLDKAESVTCNDLSHKKNQYHGASEECPTEVELREHCNAIREYMKEKGI